MQAICDWCAQLEVATLKKVHHCIHIWRISHVLKAKLHSWKHNLFKKMLRQKNYKKCNLDFIRESPQSALIDAASRVGIRTARCTVASVVALHLHAE